MEERKLQNEQRRLFFLDMLSKNETPNRVREEAFLKLLKEFKVTDFSGLNLTNVDETYRTPFNFWRCFQEIDFLTINQDTLVNTHFDSTHNWNVRSIHFDKLNLWNTNLQYSDFSFISQKRMDFQEDWLVFDEDLKNLRFIFQFQYLTDTNLDYSDLSGSLFKNGCLQNVSLKGATLQYVDFSHTSFEYCDLSGADLTGCNLDSTIFIKSKIDEHTKFTAVKNYHNIRLATPLIIQMIKATHYKDKEIQNWKFIWDKEGGSPDREYNGKWKLWNRLQKEYPLSYLKKYKQKIRNSYVQEFGGNYNWMREL